jgi:hypothetical protein
LGYNREDGILEIATVCLGGALFGMGFGVGLPIGIAMLVVLLMGFSKKAKTISFIVLGKRTKKDNHSDYSKL